MISNQNQQTTRKPWIVTVPAGAVRDLYPDCDYFYVFGIVDGGGAVQNGELSMNNDDFAPVSSGHSNQGTPGHGEIKKLTYRNNTGAPVTLSIIYGNGRSNFLGAVKINGGTVDLSAATIAALDASVELKLKIVTLAANSAPVVFSNCKSLEVIASGAGGDSVQITTASGTNYALGSGTGKEFSCETDKNHIEPVTVTPSATCGAEVTVLYF